MTRIPIALRRLTVMAVCIGLFCLQPTGHPSRAVTGLTAPELTREAVDQGAARYERAVERLNSVASMPLRTEADYKKASNIIREAAGDLDAFKYRMVQLALSNNAFTQAVEAEVSKAKGDARTVLGRFRRDRESLLSLGGARRVRQGIRAELERDLGRVRAAAERVQKAAAQATGGKSLGGAAATSGAAADSAAAGVENFFAALFTASTMVAGAVTSSRPRPKQTSSGPGGAGGTSAGSGSGEDVNEWIEKEKKYDDCVSNASEKQDACKDGCGPGLFQWACLANCDASYVIAKVGCMISAYS